MNTVQTILKNTVALTLMNIIILGVGMFFTIYIARSFGDAIFGKYSFAIAFISLFAAFFDIGFNKLIIRDVSRNTSFAKKYLSNIFLLRIITSAMFVVSIVFAINLMKYPSDTKLIVYILGVSTIFTSFGSLYRAIFHAFEKMEYDTLLTIIEKIAVVSTGFVFLFLGYNFIIVISAYLLGGILNVFLSHAVTVRKFVAPKFEIDFAFWKYSFINAIPFSLTSIFIIIFDKTDMVMISMMQGDAPVGWYNAANMIIVALLMIPGVLFGAIYPTLSKYYGSTEGTSIYIYKKFFKYIYLFELPIGICFVLLSDDIISLIYGEGFSQSSVALAILIWYFVFGSFAWLMGIILQSINKQKIFAFSMMLCATANILLNLVLIPKMSYIGASLTTVFTNIMAFFILYHFVSKYLYDLPIVRTIFRPTISGIIMAISIYLMNNMGLFSTIFVATTIYFIMLLLFRVVSKDELELVDKMMAKN